MTKASDALFIKSAAGRIGAIGGDLDFIQTPAVAVELLLDNEDFEGGIWEPTCGKGAISKILMNRGFTVESTDLIYRGFGVKMSMDFFKETNVRDNVITNPPYSVMVEFIPHALSLVKRKLALLLPLTALGASQRRARAFRDSKPTRIYCFIKKIPYVDSSGVEKGSTFPHMWVIWDKAKLNSKWPIQGPVLKWL